MNVRAVRGNWDAFIEADVPEGKCFQYGWYEETYLPAERD